MNRGRIQAQGNGCEDSESWNQNIVPTKENGYDKISILKNRLSTAQRIERQQCFRKVERFISQAPSAGYDVCNNSYTPSPPYKDVRVDVEIIKGKAFKNE